MWISGTMVLLNAGMAAANYYAGNPITAMFGAFGAGVSFSGAMYAIGEELGWWP